MLQRKTERAKPDVSGGLSCGEVGGAEGVLGSLRVEERKRDFRMHHIRESSQQVLITLASDLKSSVLLGEAKRKSKGDLGPVVSSVVRPSV